MSMKKKITGENNFYNILPDAARNVPGQQLQRDGGIAWGNPLAGCFYVKDRNLSQKILQTIRKRLNLSNSGDRANGTSEH